MLYLFSYPIELCFTYCMQHMENPFTTILRLNVFIPFLHFNIIDDLPDLLLIRLFTYE